MTKVLSLPKLKANGGPGRARFIICQCHRDLPGKRGAWQEYYAKMAAESPMYKVFVV